MYIYQTLPYVTHNILSIILLLCSIQNNKDVLFHYYPFCNSNIYRQPETFLKNEKAFSDVEPNKQVSPESLIFLEVLRLKF